MQKIVMVDQDGVVCDKSYQVTKDIAGLIPNALNSGLVIVPNSDTPIKRLRDNFVAMLDFTPEMVIGEKGAVVHVGGNDIFTGEIEGIGYYHEVLVSVMSDFGADVMIGDSATWIREGKKFKSNSSLVIIDGLRQQSIGFYLKKANARGETFTDAEWSEQALAMIKKIGLPPGLECLDYNPKYGIAISNAKNINKTNGHRVLQKLYPKAQFFMIGDGDIDIIDNEAVIHCAVANATEKLKQKASFVSEYTFTVGLEDCLKWILGS